MPRFVSREFSHGLNAHHTEVAVEIEVLEGTDEEVLEQFEELMREGGKVKHVDKPLVPPDFWDKVQANVSKYIPTEQPKTLTDDELVEDFEHKIKNPPLPTVTLINSWGPPQNRVYMTQEEMNDLIAWTSEVHVSGKEPHE